MKLEIYRDIMTLVTIEATFPCYRFCAWCDDDGSTGGETHCKISEKGLYEIKITTNYRNDIIDVVLRTHMVNSATAVGQITYKMILMEEPYKESSRDQFYEAYNKVQAYLLSYTRED